MTRRFIQIPVVGLMVLGVLGQNAFAGERREEHTSAAPIVRYDAPRTERGIVLPALYVSLGAMQAMDVYSTRQALKAGAVEANPAMAPFAGSAGSMLAVKAASTAGAIFFAERLAKRNKVAAVVLMVAVNGATAAVAAHNMQNAKRLRAR
jgi:hypothetical protein